MFSLTGLCLRARATCDRIRKGSCIETSSPLPFLSKHHPLKATCPDPSSPLHLQLRFRLVVFFLLLNISRAIILISCLFDQIFLLSNKAGHPEWMGDSVNAGTGQDYTQELLIWSNNGAILRSRKKKSSVAFSELRLQGNQTGLFIM